MSESVNLVLIAGIRPQFIKMAALLDTILRHNRDSPTPIYPVCINTGQHYDDLLSTQLFRDLDINFDFQIVHKNLTPDSIIANTFVELSNYLRKVYPKPDWVVLFGDGNPALAGALAAARQNYKIVHIEAGEKRERYEHEEITRRVVDSLSNVFFCVSQKAISCLAEDGIVENVYWAGDLAYDYMTQIANEFSSKIFKDSLNEYILASIHRPENLEATVLTNIVTALNEYSKKVIFICHPRTKHKLQELDLWDKENIQYLEPLSFKEVLAAIKGSTFLFTDSGGLIREASHLGKRCIVRRTGGAWSELIDLGFNLRIGTKLDELRSALRRMGLLSSQNIQPPKLLFRQDGGSFALNVLCSLTKQYNRSKT